MERKKILLLILLSIVVLLFFSGCKEKLVLISEDLSFEGDILRVKIKYFRVDFGGLAETLFYEINKVDNEFVTKEGKTIDSEKIYDLSKSLVNLHVSGGLKSCMSHTDDYPGYEVEILYSDGERVVLSSDSNCYKNIPWNVVAKDKLFVQYTGEISDALSSILEKESRGSMSFMPPISLTGGSIPREFEYNYEGFFEFSDIYWSAYVIANWGLSRNEFFIGLENSIDRSININKVIIKSDGDVYECAVSKDSRRERFKITCHLDKANPSDGSPFEADVYIEYEDENGIKHKTEGSIKGQWAQSISTGVSFTPKLISFSEKEFYLNILTKSHLFKPFSSSYEISNLALTCQLSENNTGCSEVDGTVTLKSIDGETIESVSVKFKNQKVIEIGYDFKEMEDIKKKIYEHALVKRIKSFIPDTNVIIKGLSLIRFDKWDVSNEFIYSPETDEMRVDHLWYYTKAFQEKGKVLKENKDILNLDKVLELYRVPGYETFVDNNIIDFEVQNCDRLIVTYKEGVLEQNPDYIQKLKEKYTRFYHFENAISIYNYCIFVNDKGELEAKPAQEKKEIFKPFTQRVFEWILSWFR